MSFGQVILACLNKIITRLNDLLSVTQLTETSRNVPKRTSLGTETDFKSVPKRSRMWFQLTQKPIQ